MRTNLLSFLDDCGHRGDETIIAYKHGLRMRRWSYGRLRSSAYRIARALEARGIGSGDRVLFWADNSAEWVAAFFGCLVRGAIVVPLDIDSSPDFAERVQTQVEAKLLLADQSDRRLAQIGVPILTLTDLTQSSEAYSDAKLDVSEIKSGDIAEIIFTSGTTAEPKGVCITHRNILANLEPIEREMQKYLRYERFVHPVRFLNLLPLSHVFGQFMGIFVPQLMGGEIFFLDSLNSAEIFETVRKHRISLIVTVPRILESLRSKIERDWVITNGKTDLSSLMKAAENYGPLKRWWAFLGVHRRVGLKFWAVISGGAALPEDTEAFWRRLGFAVIQGYGMTETASLVTVNHPFKMGRGSIGKTLPGQEVKLGESGEILVRGENVSPGYWKGGLQPIAGEDGWLKTGDVASIDEDGNLYFKSRSKDVIVTAAGLNIYPDDLEAAIKAQPKVRDASVVSTEGAQGPEPLAVLLLHDQSTDAGSVIKEANKRLNQYQQIRRWIVWPDPDFPRTATEKIRKPAVIERLQTMKAPGSSNRRGGMNPESTFTSFVVNQIERITGQTPTNQDRAAVLSRDLGLDSIGRVELLSAIEDRFQVELDEAVLTEETTLDDVERLIRNASSIESKPRSAIEEMQAELKSVTAERPQTTPSQPDQRDSPENRAGRLAEGVSPAQTRATQSTARAKSSYPTWQLSWLVRVIRLAILYLVILPITRIMSRAEIIGRDKLTDIRGPVLVISNHVAMVDQALVLLALPGRMRNRLSIAMEGERLWNWRHPRHQTGLIARIIGPIQYVLVVALFNVFPLPQKSGFRRSFAYAGDRVDEGRSVLVFPEGRRAESLDMNPFMDGIGLLGQGLQVPVVPMRLVGLAELKSQGRRFASRGQIRVVVGDPINVSESDDPSRVTRELERAVRAL